MLPVINSSTLRVQNSCRFQSPPNCNCCQNSQSPPFSTIQISHSMQICNFWISMNNSSISPQSVNSTKDNSCLANTLRHCILCENSTLTQEFPNKIGSLRHCHITQAKDKKPNAKLWHSCCCSTLIFQCFGMSSIVQISYTQKQSRTPYSVCLHCHDCSNNSNFIHCKQS